MTTRYDPRDLNINTFTTKDLLKASPRSLQATATGTLGGGGSQGLDSQPRAWQNLAAEANPQVRPPFLDPRGKWDNSRLPGMIIESRAQALTAPGVFTAAGTLKKSLNVEGPKAIASVYSYNDVSPAVNTECAHDATSWQTRTTDTWDPTVQKLRTARHHGERDRVDGRTLTGGQAMMLTSRGAQGTLIAAEKEGSPTVMSLTMSGRGGSTRASEVAPGSDVAETLRKESVDAFWARMKGSGGSSQLSLRDVTRCHDTLSQHVVAGGHNAVLIAGNWKPLQRPLVGAPLFTDYYGRFDTQTGNYYGRSWHHAA